MPFSLFPQHHTFTMISQAADYNHTGIQLLSQGNLMQALEMFKEATQLLKNAARENGIQRCQENSSVTVTRPCQCSSDQESTQDSNGPSHPPHSAPACPRVDIDGCFMVCSPLEIVSSDNLRVSSAAAIVVFNMALTYHLLPVISCQRLSARRYALSLYEMSYNLALADIESEVCSRLTMVTLLNMALIQKELGDSQEAEQCLVDLSEYITALEAESASEEVSSQRNEFLLKATLLLRSPHGAAAA
jgi:tetratricopeptide (TPR) repeat protein